MQKMAIDLSDRSLVRLYRSEISDNVRLNELEEELMGRLTNRLNVIADLKKLLEQSRRWVWDAEELVAINKALEDSSCR